MPYVTIEISVIKQMATAITNDLCEGNYGTLDRIRHDPDGAREDIRLTMENIIVAHLKEVLAHKQL